MSRSLGIQRILPTQRADGSVVTVIKPEVVHEYNRHRGGVDTVDQLRGN